MREDLRDWMRETMAREQWFVDPPHHVAKPETAIDVGILSHFTYKFSLVALGHLSLYHRINRRADCPGIADRVFVYDPLATEEGLIQPDLVLNAPLATLERQIPLHRLQLICISLTNPDAITSALNLLRLGGVPPRREDRAAGNFPLVLAGGPGCCNPEPFADYCDLFCVGDGCALTARIVSALHDLRRQGERPTAKKVFERIPDKKGLYVPSLYRFNYAGGSVTSIESLLAPATVEPAVDPDEEWSRSSLVSDGETAVLVPTQGCKHSCSYCQISEIDYRQFAIGPLLKRVDEYLERGIRTLIINSATLTQHSEVENLLSGIGDRVDASGKPVKVYIGSVRFDEVSADVLAKLGRLQAFSHTYLLYTNGAPMKYMALAPEHGSRDLMRRMRRKVDPWRMLNTVDLAAKQGVHHFVLYFIVGFESETAEDRDQISALTAALLARIEPAGGKVIMKINPLIPTPGTACQRMAMPSMEQYNQYLREIADGLIRRVGFERYQRQVEVVPLPEKRLIIEMLINRADRRIGPLIELLTRSRARGVEPGRMQLTEWLAECGLSWDDLSGSRPMEGIVPWRVVDRTDVLAERKVLVSFRERTAACSR
ncbi:MAG: radical SAM protein [Zoogloeaceae bacterium]|nr:radical SAM protein [Zoogloeaceae bacterium]